ANAAGVQYERVFVGACMRWRVRLGRDEPSTAVAVVIAAFGEHSRQARRLRAGHRPLNRIERVVLHLVQSTQPTEVECAPTCVLRGRELCVLDEDFLRRTEVEAAAES